MSRNFALRGTRVAGMFAIRAESPNSLEDSRDRAVVTVDYRRYHQITGVGRNEIVRRHVGARWAEKKEEKKSLQRDTGGEGEVGEGEEVQNRRQAAS